MTPTWRGSDPPITGSLGWVEWLRVSLKGGALGVIVFGGLALLLLARLAERPVFGAARPVTPHITQAVCRVAIRILGPRVTVTGRIDDRASAIVANHASWIDIFALNALTRVYFVAKDEVAGWPGIGWLARATGTVFIRRARRDAAAHRSILETRLKAGHRLLFFPEGTSSDGCRVLPFKPTLFAAFLGSGHDAPASIQPVTLIYTAPPRTDPRFYGWWGDMAFAPHLAAVLARGWGGRLEIVCHPVLRTSHHPDRKALAVAAEAAVRAPIEARGIRNEV